MPHATNSSLFVRPPRRRRADARRGEEGGVGGGGGGYHRCFLSSTNLHSKPNRRVIAVSIHFATSTEHYVCRVTFVCRKCRGKLVYVEAIVLARANNNHVRFRGSVLEESVCSRDQRPS